MIDKELLEAINQIDINSGEINNDGLTENLELLEKAHSNLHNILIMTRMRKIMQDFGEKETDVYVVTYPKSGTTLMQMIVYQMTTDGNMDFGHLYDVSPWCRFSASMNRPMASVGERRIIKTHDEYSMLKGIRKGKFIFVIRDYLDVVSSLHEHIKNYSNPKADFDELCNRKMKEWFDYNKKWIINEHGLEILYINYEDLIADKRDIILKISRFLDIKIDNEIISRVLERTSFEFMKKHKSRFGEQPEQWKVYNNFIRKGKAGEGKGRFTTEQINQYKSLFSKSSKFSVKPSLIIFPLLISI